MFLVCQLEGWEGDEPSGTPARRGEAEGLPDVALSRVTVMYQLSTENVAIVFNKWIAGKSLTSQL